MDCHSAVVGRALQMGSAGVSDRFGAPLLPSRRSAFGQTKHLVECPIFRSATQKPTDRSPPIAVVHWRSGEPEAIQQRHLVRPTNARLRRRGCHSFSVGRTGCFARPNWPLGRSASFLDSGHAAIGELRTLLIGPCVQHRPALRRCIARDQV